MKLTHTYTLLYSGILLLFSSCSSFIYDNEDDFKSSTKDQAEVYLSVTRAAHTFGEESINEDIDDFEDRVHDFAMLVFDSSTGNLVGSYFEANIPISHKAKTFVSKLPIGTRDFYFIANRDLAELQAITNRSQMITYMQSFQNLNTSLYLSASEPQGFPMARVYTNQTLVAGGTIYTPLPFKPDGEDKVKLIRVVAKLEVRLLGSNLGVTKISYRNAFRQYSMLSPTTGNYTPQVYYTDQDLSLKGTSYVYYMPETLHETAVWSSFANHRPINYFDIETTSGTVYSVPIITYSGTIANSQYIAVATGTTAIVPDYNIYRNRHYVYEIHNLQTIQITYNLDPWQYKLSSLFMGYGYNVEVDENGLVKISNTVEACDPHEIVLTCLGSFQFSDSSTTKIFNNSDPDAGIQYQLQPVPQAGDGAYLQVSYNGSVVKTFSL